MAKQEFEVIQLSITSDAGVFEIAHTTDTKHKTILGIGLEVSDSTAILQSKLNLLVDDKTIFPKEFEAVRLVCGDAVEPNKRFWLLNEPIEIKQSQITGSYTDGDNWSATYEVNIYLLVEKE